VELGWTPETFWLCSLTEFFAAVRHYSEVNSYDGNLSYDDYEDLQALIEEHG